MQLIARSFRPPSTKPQIYSNILNRELNHSETVFVRQRQDSSPNEFDIRFYTPTAEEPFCGHGILGAAHALYAADLGSKFHFTTFTGIKASAFIISKDSSKVTGKESATISMSFPSSPVLPSLRLSQDVRIGFAHALGIEPSTILEIGQNALRDIILEVDPEIDFSAAKMRIDPVALLGASPAGTRSQVITSSWDLDADVDFAKRVFAYGSEGRFPFPLFFFLFGDGSLEAVLMASVGRSSYGLDVLRAGAVLGRETQEERTTVLATVVERWWCDVKMEE